MSAVKVHQLSATAGGASAVQIYQLSATATAPAGSAVRLYQLSATATAALVAVIDNAASTGLGALTTRVLRSSGSLGTPSAWEWTQIAGPAVTVLGASGPTATYDVPAMPNGSAVTMALRVGDGTAWSPATSLTDVIARHRYWKKEGLNRVPVFPKTRPVIGPPPPDPIPPSPTVGAGSLTPGLASYDVPLGAYYVALTGSDVSGNGSSGAPYATVAKALTAAPTDGTIVIRGGVYHEASINVTKAGTTIQNYPGEAVWFDGSYAETSWVAEGTLWRTTYTRVTDRSPTFGRGALESTTPGFGFINTAYPCAAWPDQVFIDGVGQQQVANKTDVGPGKFWVQTTLSGTNNFTSTPTALYLGTNPVGKQVRITDLTWAFQVAANDSTIRGIGVRKYGPSNPDFGSVRIVYQGDELENVVVEDSATQGIHIGSGRFERLNHVTVTRAGLLGLHSNNSDDLTVENSLFQQCNTENFNFAPAAGGAKMTRMQRVLFRNNVFANNNCDGLWFDESVYQVQVIGCDSQNNRGHGIVFELCAEVLAANCLVTGNGKIGIFPRNSDKVRVWNCTAVGNSETEINFTQDNRRPQTDAGKDTRQPDSFYDQATGAMTWVIHELEVKNLVAAPRAASSTGGVYLRSSETVKKDASYMTPDIDGTFFHRTNASTPTAIVRWQRVTAADQYATLTAYKTATGQDVNGYLVDAATGVFSPAFTLQAPYDAQDTTAVPLPADVATLVGKTTGTTHRGAWR